MYAANAGNDIDDKPNLGNIFVNPCVIAISPGSNACATAPPTPNVLPTNFLVVLNKLPTNSGACLANCSNLLYPPLPTTLDKSVVVSSAISITSPA